VCSLSSLSLQPFIFSGFSFVFSSGECASEYWKDMLVCRTCGTDEADVRRIRITLAMAIILVLLVAVGVASLASSTLSTFVTGSVIHFFFSFAAI
jgi:hypothetical protein